MQNALRPAGLGGLFAGLILMFLPGSADAASVTVTIRNNQYIPNSITVNPGDTITWINQDSVPHTVTDGVGAFDSGSIAPGQSYSITVQIPATRTYRCEFHPGMSGSINVVAASNTGTTNTVVNTTTSANASALAAQAEALLQQIAAIQAQLAGGSGTVSTGSAPTSGSNCPLIGRVLRLASTGDDVTRLQAFLASDPSIYPEAMITGYYGSLTEAAVKRWQTKFNIVSSGDAASTGFGVVGPRTAAAIALQCGNSSGGGGSNVSSPTVGGFIQVTPVSGNSPLTVQVVATVNTVNSCQGATYTIDWGDGTIAQNIQVPAGSCGQLQQTFSHIYLYGGTYLVRLSAGQHSTTATVQVFGANQPNPIVTPGPINSTPYITVSAPASGQSTTLGGNLGITWTAQNAPSGSKVRLEVYRASDTPTSGNNDNGLNSNTSELQTSGSYTWTLPASGGASLADAGYGGLALVGGTYKIFAKLYSGSTCWGFCSGTISRTIHASDDSAAFTLNVPFSFGPLGVSPGVSGNPLAVGASFNIPSSCTGYSLSWGDGTTSATQAHSTSCTQSAVTRSFTHQYASSGNYTITLRRGSDLSQIDTASVTISN